MVFLLISQLEAPVLCTKAAIHCRSSELLKSFLPTRVCADQNWCLRMLCRWACKQRMVRCHAGRGTELLTGQLCQGGLVRSRWSIVTLPVWRAQDFWLASCIGVVFFFLLYLDCLFYSPLDPWRWSAAAWTAMDSSVVMHRCRQWKRVSPDISLGPGWTSEF